MRYTSVPWQNNDADCAILMIQKERIFLNLGKLPYPIADAPNFKQLIAPK